MTRIYTTSATITDEQIVQLRHEAAQAGDLAHTSICDVALSSAVSAARRAHARTECARVIQAAEATAMPVVPKPLRLASTLDIVEYLDAVKMMIGGETAGFVDADVAAALDELTSRGRSYLWD
jgi:hypothetical protein